MTVILDLPLRTSAQNNTREFWTKRAARVKAERKAVWACWVAAGGRKLEPGEGAIVRLTRVAPKFLDWGDNDRSSLKAVRDQIAAELGVDDSSPRVIWNYDQARSLPGIYGVHVEIDYRDES